MYCKECGTELKGNELTCPYCGKTVTFLNSTNIAPSLQQPNTMPTDEPSIEQSVAPSAEMISEQTTEQTETTVNAEYGTADSAQQSVSPQAAFCSRCGQKLAEGANVCSFCGQAVIRPNPATPYPYFAYQPQPMIEKKGTALGVVALICSLIIPYGYFFAWIMGIIATVQGSKTKNTPALVLGIISIVVCALAILGAITILSGGTDTILMRALRLFR